MLARLFKQCRSRSPPMMFEFRTVQSTQSVFEHRQPYFTTNSQQLIPTEQPNDIIQHMSETEIINLIQTFLNTIQNDIYPLTKQQVLKGDDVFGGSIHSAQSPYKTIVFDTNRISTMDPIYHGETSTIHKFYKMKYHKEYNPKDCLFLATHEPCSLCLSSLPWCGFSVLFYLFSYSEYSKQADSGRILTELFGVTEPYYNHSNEFFVSYHIKEIIDSKIEDKHVKQKMHSEIDKITRLYEELNQIARGRSNVVAE